MDAAVINENDSAASDPDRNRFNENPRPTQCTQVRQPVSPGAGQAMCRLRVPQTRAEPHLARITCPPRMINAEADTGVVPSDAQRIDDALASTDKLKTSIGTDHYFTPLGAGDQQADVIAEWMTNKWS